MSDVVGVRWTVPSAAYQVYHDFKERLLRLTPRFNRINEMGQLPAALCQGKQWVDTILHDTQCFQQLPDVTIFFSNSVQPSVQTEPTISQLVTNKHVLDSDPCHSTPISWSDIMESKMQNHNPIIVVLILQLERDADSIPPLPDVQKNNIVCYDQSTGRSWPYSGTNLTKDEVTVDSLTLEDNGYKSLATLIQTLLERKVIHVFENISAFIKKFETNDCEQQKRSLLDESNRKQKLYLRKNYVAHELETIHDVCMQEANATEYNAMDVDEALSSGSPQKKHKSNAEEIKDEKIGREIFRRCTKMLATNARCNIVVEYLSRRYGISQIYIASFLSNGDFHFENNYMAIFEKTSIDHWLTTRKYKEDKHKMAKFFSDKCVTAFTELLNETSTCITDKLHVIETLQKLQFEVRGLLRQTTTKLQIIDMKDLAPSPPLPIELQKDILDIGNVEGCGTIYGKLTLHVHKILPEEDKGKIEGLLTKYEYTHGYKLERIEHKTISAGNDPYFDVGNGYRATFTRTGEHSYGTVCCYVNIKEKETVSENENVAKDGETDEGNVDMEHEPTVDDTESTTDEKESGTSPYKRYTKSRSKDDQEIITKEKESDLTLSIAMETETNTEKNEPSCYVAEMKITKNKIDQNMSTVMETETKSLPRKNKLLCDTNIIKTYVKESDKGSKESLPDGLYFLTCAHCVEHCKENVTCKNGHHFGHNSTNGSNLIHVGQSIDIAAVRVRAEIDRACDTRFKSSGFFGPVTAVPANLYQGEGASLEGHMVFKKGAQSGTTFGIVIGSNYATEVFADARYDKNLNILVDGIAGGSDEVKKLKWSTQGMQEMDESPDNVFSLNGDSGSAICEENSGGTSVSVVSILTGSVTVPTQPGQQNTVYYTSCHLQHSINQLANKTDRQIILENNLCADCHRRF